MAEYIEREAVLAKQYNGSRFANLAFAEMVVAVSDIEEIPAVDGVPVVRCKDCKHRETVICPMSATYEEYPWKDTRDNDFCSYGERREGE